jgi:membrane protease subunit HflK
MSMISGWAGRARGLFADNKGPWGPKGSGDEPEEPAPGPWGETPKRGKRTAADPMTGGSSLDEFLRRSRARFSTGGGGGLPGRPNASLILWGALGLLAVWLVFTSFHSISPSQRGVVTQFGRYSRTLSPGVGLTLPSPIEKVRKIDVENIRNPDLGSGNSTDLMLTGDQNLIDIAYTVRWNIRTPELYLFELAQPDETIHEVAESAMRSIISQVSLNDAMGDRRADIETLVAEKMQQILDHYRSGIQIQGIAIKQADPPDQVNDAFKQVTAAQQDAQTYINNANAYSLQLGQKAQGEATAFQKVYEQYRLAPEVTRRRMYYETMERVLQGVNKTIIEAPGVLPYQPLPPPKQSQPTEGASQ